MKNLYVLKTLLFLTLILTLSSCASDDSKYEEISPVEVDLTLVPYPLM